MKRRRVLQGIGAAALAATWPWWVQKAFAGFDRCSSPHLDPSVQTVANGFRAAAQAGRPLLVFIVPVDRDSAWDRGHAFGELLNQGSDEALAPLALAHVVCAPMSAVQKLVRSPEGEPLMVVVETEKVPVKVTLLEARLPRWGGLAAEFLAGRRGYPQPVADTDEDASIIDRIGVLSQLLRQGLAADEAMIAQRIRQAQLDADELPARLRLEAIDHSQAWTERLAPSLYAIWLRSQARGQSDVRGAEALALLSEAVRARLVNRPIRGARWARESGCAPRYEDDENALGTQCGMGYLPAKSKRFLAFYWK